MVCSTLVQSMIGLQSRLLQEPGPFVAAWPCRETGLCWRRLSLPLQPPRPEQRGRAPRQMQRWRQFSGTCFTSMASLLSRSMGMLCRGRPCDPSCSWIRRLGKKDPKSCPWAKSITRALGISSLCPRTRRNLWQWTRPMHISASSPSC